MTNKKVLHLPTKTPKDASLTVRIPKSVRSDAEKIAAEKNTTLAAVVEAGIVLLKETLNEKAK